ncbi:MAG: CHAP domain-containing protein [Lachnospiraceae bacterium]|nr:CHAP domain-containing protein [Lachnospiraceae bacterium]
MEKEKIQKHNVFAKSIQIFFMALFAAGSMLVSVLSTTVQAEAKTQAEAVQWVQSQVGKSIDADGVYGAQCVDLILAYYDYLGVPRSSGNGKDYAHNALPAGWQRLQGGAPQAGDILVYGGSAGNPYGHVAIFESERVHYHQNFNGKPSVQRITYRYNGLNDPYWGVIRPSFSAGTRTDYLNLGDSFDALIIRSDIWRPIQADGANVVLSAQEKGRADFHWHFERQGDGSYIITSLYNGLALDVTGAAAAPGTNVGLYERWGDDNGAQKWYVFGNAVAFELAPKLALGLRLDVAGGGTTGGTNIQIHTENHSVAQTFSVYPLTDKGPTAINITGETEMAVGDSQQLGIDCGAATAWMTVHWSSSDENVASVDASGKITAKAPGSAKITAVSDYNDHVAAHKEIAVVQKDDTPPVVSNVEIVEQTEEAIIVEADVTDDAGIAHVRNRWRTAIIPGGSKEGLMGGGFPSTTTWLTDTRIRISIEITGDAVDEDFMSMAGEHHRLYIFAEDTAGNESEWVGVDLFIPVSPYVQMQVGETKTCKALFNRDNMAGHQEFCLPENGEEAIEIQDGVYRAVKPGRVLLIYMGNTRGNMRSRIIQVKGGGGAVETPTGTPTPLPTNTVAPTPTGTPIPTGTATGTPIPTDTETPSPLKSQTITGASSYTKVYGDKAFYLRARAGSRLSYQTSAKSVVEVSAAGKVTIKGCGKAVITITAAESSFYQKSVKKVTVTVKPKSMKISSLRSPKKKTARLAWKRDSKVSGYEIQYSQNNKFPSGKTTKIQLKKNSYTNREIGKLASRKKYYVRIRSYKTVGKSALYGGWSKVKSVKVK